MPKTQNMKHEPLIETTPLRLTADETRLIIRLVTSGKDRDRNETRYRYVLSDLGKQIARGVSIRLGQTGR